MKSVLSLMVLAFAMAVTGPVFAEDPPPATEDECNKTPDMEWDADAGKCVQESPGG